MISGTLIAALIINYFTGFFTKASSLSVVKERIEVSDLLEASLEETLQNTSAEKQQQDNGRGTLNAKSIKPVLDALERSFICICLSQDMSCSMNHCSIQGHHKRRMPSMGSVLVIRL